ncbi:choline/carnitine O-acyltransferase [candidate division WWE3 bacterium]|nr:choline/carnitine O-acyltransferase [candidate division WWE3 bacterium]
MTPPRIERFKPDDEFEPGEQEAKEREVGGEERRSPVEGVDIHEEEILNDQIAQQEDRLELLQQEAHTTEDRLAAARAELGIETADPITNRTNAEINHIQETLKLLRYKLLTVRLRKPEQTPTRDEKEKEPRLPKQPVATEKELYANLGRILDAKQRIIFNQIYRRTLGWPTEKNLEAMAGLENWQSLGWEYYVLSGREGLYKMNFPMVIERDPGKTTPVDRASSLASGALEFAHQVRTGTLPQEVIPATSTSPETPLDETQYARIFGSSRMPGERVDSIQLSKNNPTHFLVKVKGHYVRIEGFRDDEPIPAEEVRAQIAAAVESINDLPDAPPIGAITAGNRKRNFEFRQRIQSSTANQELQDEIDQSLFVVCIDPESKPDTLADEMAEVRDSKGKNLGNREYNKGLQIIVSGSDERGASAGFSFEHALVDGTVGGRFAVDVSRMARRIEYQGEPQRAEQIEIKDWESSPQLAEMAQAAQAEVEKKLENSDETTFELEGDWLERCKQFGIKGDTAFQMALQIAEYMKYRKPISNSEQVSLRAFEKGRINPTGVTTHGVKEFLRDFGEVISAVEHVEEDGDVEKAIRQPAYAKRLGQALAKAIQDHEKTIDLAKSGKGVETHLMAQWAALNPSNPSLNAEAQTAADNLFRNPAMGVRSFLQPILVSSNLRPRSDRGEVVAAGTKPSRSKRGNLSLGYLLQGRKISVNARTEGKMKDHAEDISHYLESALNIVAELAPYTQ